MVDYQQPYNYYIAYKCFEGINVLAIHEGYCKTGTLVKKNFDKSSLQQH